MFYQTGCTKFNKSFFPANSPISAISVLGLLTLMLQSTGCQPEEDIYSYRVPKNRSGFVDRSNSIGEGSAPFAPFMNRQAAEEIITEPLSEEECTDRMAVAIFEVNDKMWFFKLTGAIEPMHQHQEQWLDFFQQVNFVSGNPEWKLPDNWSTGPSRAMRFATLFIGDYDPPLELAISNLPIDQDLLLNVNRWRGQMRQPPITQDQMDADLRSITNNAGPDVPGYLFDVIGQLSENKMANMPNPEIGTQLDSALGLSAGPAGVPNYLPLSGWEVGAQSAMVPIRLQKSEGERSVQISVTQLPAAANEWEPNAARWAAEVGLDDWNTVQLADATDAIEVDRISGKLIRLIPEDPKQQRAVIAGMLVQNNIAWFVKLSGDKELVVASDDDFKLFLNSMKFSR